MFVRGNWAIFGLDNETLTAFSTALDDPARMAVASQQAAAAVARLYGTDAIGFNPFSAPRLDEEQELTAEQQTELARHAVADLEEATTAVLPAEILEGTGYGRTAEAFRVSPQLSSELPWFGLWAVLNEWKKASDLPSRKEQSSYVLLERPYKFLLATDKKTVDEKVEDASAVCRTQVAVLLDFVHGRLYIESTSKKHIQAIVAGLTRLAVQIVPVAWNYPVAHWTQAILRNLYENTQFRDEFARRAEEARRFKESEIEKLEDREMEMIVSKFFSMTETPTGTWVGISGPARIRLHEAAPPIAVRNPAMATTLLGITPEAALLSGALTFQDTMTVTTKSGAERTIRRDVARFDLNDRVNLSEVGAAMLRGFDMASHKKDVLRAIRDTRQVPSIAQFWGLWLHQLGSAVRTIEATFREVLELNGDEAAGIIPMQLSGGPEETPAP
jgi:hypothetical protein